LPLPPTGNTVKAKMASGKISKDVTFDSDYYDRFYLNSESRIYDRVHQEKLIVAVVSLVEWFGAELSNVLDIGAGVGWWRDWFAEHRTSTKYVSTELDAKICSKFRHVQRDIRTWRARQKFDLIICQGVLPYLADDDCAKAIDNIIAMSAGFLFIEAITRKDIATVCDTSRTDTRVHTRAGKWYRDRLHPHFRFVGAGLYYVRDGEISFYELEAGD
jgi:2-polyprenyl-3-methyl-5-hydroxy-6-metoxy-1,4-benzoquinol methylase